MFLNAIKNVVRGWKKTLLFWLLIVLIALFFISSTVLAVGMKQYSDETYASYRTIGLFEYVGDAYPDETVYSENAGTAARALEAMHLESDPRVEQWDLPQKALGYNSTIRRIDQEIPYYDNAVFLVKTGSKEKDTGYFRITVEKAFYSVRKMEGRSIKLDPMLIPVESSRYYIVNGFLEVEGTPFPIIHVHSFRNAAAETSGFDGSIEQMLVDVTTPEGGYEIPNDCPLLKIAETYRVVNDGIDLYYTADVESLLPFEQEALYLTDGRFFTPDEYANGEDVCIITNWVSERLGVGVGDSVPLSVVSNPECSSAECYWDETGFDAQKAFTVVGVTNANQEYLHEVFIPKNAETPIKGNFSYTLGIARLDNDGAEAFYAEVSPNLPENVRLLIYDQGWSTVSEPLRSVRKTVIWLSVLSGAAMLTLAVVFGFLFVYSDRKSAQIMMRLGTNVPKVYGHYLIGAGLIAVTAVAVSVILSSVFLPKIITAMDRTLTSAVVDHTLDYSNAALSFARPLEPLKAPASGLLLLGGGIVVLLSVMSCALFAYAAMKNPMQRRETVSHRTHKGKSVSLTGGSLRYAVLSAVRGGARSIVPFIVMLLCTVMLLGLAAARQSYVEQLDSIRKNTKIKGVYTDISGRRTDGLLVEAYLINDLYRSGLVEDIHVSARGYASYVGRSVIEDGTETIEMLMDRATTPELLEKYSDLFSADRLLFTDDMMKHPIFGDVTPSVHWLDGYDASIFQSDSYETVTIKVPADPSDPTSQDMENDAPVEFTETTEFVLPLVVPERFLSDRNVELGDIVVLSAYRITAGQYDTVLWRFRVVGSYHCPMEVNYLFGSMEHFVPRDFRFSEDESMREWLYWVTYDNAQFTLKNSEDLLALKDFFRENGYSEVRQIRRNRTFIVLNDSGYLYTTAQLEKRIASLPSFYPLAVGVGAAIAFIIVFLRRREVITMKLLGTGRFRAWLNLWLEQILLCAAGVGTALLGFRLYRHTVQSEGLLWLLFLTVGYLFSAALSAALICFTKLSSRSKEV